MINILCEKSTTGSTPLLVGNDDTEIQAEAAKYGLPVIPVNGHKLCYLGNGKVDQLLAAGVTKATPAQTANYKLIYGV